MKSMRLLLATTAVLVLTISGAWAQEFPKPSAEHEQLKLLAGEWDAQIKCHQPGKGLEESKGTYSGKLDVGGFFLVTKFDGEIGGQPFQGRGFSGYDPTKKKYVGVWIDSMSPAIYQTEGEFDKSGKTYNEIMEGPSPDGKPMKMRMTTEVKDADHLLFKMFAPGEDGKEAMMMEIAYSRKK